MFLVIIMLSGGEKMNLNKSEQGLVKKLESDTKDILEALSLESSATELQLMVQYANLLEGAISGYYIIHHHVPSLDEQITVGYDCLDVMIGVYTK